MCETQDPHLLLDCVRSMTLHGRFGGMEVGFLFSFGWWVMRGTRPALLEAEKKKGSRSDETAPSAG
jgi:hypothetical protein